MDERIEDLAEHQKEHCGPDMLNRLLYDATRAAKEMEGNMEAIVGVGGRRIDVLAARLERLIGYGPETAGHEARQMIPINRLERQLLERLAVLDAHNQAQKNTIEDMEATMKRNKQRQWEDRIQRLERKVVAMQAKGTAVKVE